MRQARPSGRPQRACWRRCRPAAPRSARIHPRLGRVDASKGITPHVAQKAHGAIDRRTTRHPGYAVSQRLRKRVEEIFGWMTTSGGLRKLRHRAGARVEWQFPFVAAVYNLVRLRTLPAEAA